MILICDDDPIFGEKLKGLLSDKVTDKDINLFSSCEELFAFLKDEKAKENFPSVVFMDLMMPDTDGFQCITFIKNIFPPFTVVGMTNGTEQNPGIDNEYAAELYRAGFSSLFIKSYRLADLNKYISAIDTMWINNPITPVFKRTDESNREHTNAWANT